MEKSNCMMADNTIDIDAASLKFMLTLDPLTLRSFVTANRERWQIYETHEDLIWQKMIQRDFSELFELLQINTTSLRTGSDEKAYMNCLKSVLNQIAWATSSTFVERLPTGDILSALTLLLELNHSLLKREKARYFVRVGTFLLRHRPDLLESIVRLFPDSFYREGDGVSADFTTVLLDELDFMTDAAKRRAIPILFKLFIEPYDVNPAGYLNRHYSDITKTRLQKLIVLSS